MSDRKAYNNWPKNRSFYLFVILLSFIFFFIAINIRWDLFFLG